MISRFRRVELSFTVLLFIAICPAGCGTKDGFSGDRGTVSGTIIRNGKPVPKGCQVMFIGADARTDGKKMGFTAVGQVDAEGKYSMTYNNSNQLPAVKYSVQIIPPLEKSAPPGKMDPASMKPLMNNGKSKPADDNGPIPSKYFSALTSKLEFTVKKGPNKADFDL